MYDVSSGSIKIDNIEIKKVNLKDLRKSIGYIPQDSFLFSDSIENNIKFGKQNSSHNEVIKAAKIADVDKNIKKFKKGYKTILGERGINLSGGQKQRISIARAIIKEPKILLLDDCLSAVDTETEKRILGNLQNLMKNLTTIIVSHRISCAKNADNILVMERGEIVQQGTHDELIKINGYYKSSYKKQLNK